MTTINAGAAATFAGRLSDQESLGGGARSIFVLDDPLIVTLDELEPFPEFRLWTKKIPWCSPEKTARIVERLKRFAVRAPNGRCILWSGSLNRANGYGRLALRHPWYPHPYPEYVHRLSWWLVHGKDIPEDDEVDHECDTPPCFNPLCVRLLSSIENAQRSAINTNRKKAARRAPTTPALRATPPQAGGEPELRA